MSLSEKLDAIREMASKRIPSDKLAIMHAVTAEQTSSGVAEQALGVGAALPPFELSNHNGETVRSADLLAQGPLVLTVYRGVW